MSVRATVKYLTRRSMVVRRWYEWYVRRQARGLEPDWSALVTASGNLWTAAKHAAQGPRVLLATSSGGHPSAPILDSLLGAALTLRGAQVHYLLCDNALPACQMVEFGLQRPREVAALGPQDYSCRDCYPRGRRIYDPLGLPTHLYSECVTEEERRLAEQLSREVAFGDLGGLEFDGVPIGEHATAGALRYYARATFDDEPEAEAILRRFVRAAMLTMYVTRRLVRTADIDVLCVHHGIYVPHGIVAEVVRREERRIVAWNVAYRKRSFLFSHSETYHHTLMSEPVSDWDSMSWGSRQESDILEYLRSRRRGGRDWIVFQSTRPIDNLKDEAAALAGLDLTRPVIGLLTNVAWDAQLHYPANAFSNMMEWVLETVGYFARRADLQLLIRIHPAEISGDIPSRQHVADALRSAFPTLPANVFVVRPESRVSTYAAMEACNAVIIYGTKTGVELTSLGIPVIVAGEAWIRNKGLTIDAASKAEYYRILDQLPLPDRMPESSIARARKYAYHFFFRRMIPVGQVEPTGSQPQFRVNIRSLDDLQPGRSVGLDVVCDGILNGSPFIYPAEVLTSTIPPS